jgi:hypothetical protein
MKIALNNQKLWWLELSGYTESKSTGVMFQWHYTNMPLKMENLLSVDGKA